MKTFAFLIGIIHALATILPAETIDRTGASGMSGDVGSSPGQAGGNGQSGESLTDSVVSPADANKTLTLNAGNGGAGAPGGANTGGTGGSGGRGGHGGNAGGTAEITADAPSQILSMTIRGGSGGFGASGASSAGSGGNAGNAGDASATATLTAGPSTTSQRATLQVVGGNSSSGGSGHIDTDASIGGTAGRTRAGGEADTLLVMHGSAATTSQQVNISASASSSGTHGSGAGVPLSLTSDPSHPVGAEIDLDLFTPANNSSVVVNASTFGGNGFGRPDSISGGPLPSRGVVRASRVEASGSNANLNASLTAVGGSCFTYSKPNPGISFALPGDFPSTARGASPLVEPLDLVVGSGIISGTINMTGGNGGGAVGSGAPRAGDGGRVEVSGPVLRAVSGGGNITLSLLGSGGNGGSGISRNGIGGHVSLFNGLSASTPTGAVTLSQNAFGGPLGGRAASHLEIDGTTSGSLTVNSNASGGQVSSNSSASSSLGSGDATAIVRGIGTSTTANVFATGNTAATQGFGAFAKALADVTGPSGVSAVASARAGKGVIHGKSTATSVARATSPGSVVRANSSTNGDLGVQSCTAISEGHPALPVSWLASTYSADRISRGFSDTSNSAVTAANLSNGSFIFFATRTASFDDQDTTQRNSAVNTPLVANPVPAAFFDNLSDEKHLISCRFVREVGSLEYPVGRTTTHTHGGAFRLRAGASGGQLVLSGLGFTPAGGGFDSGVFRFFKDGVALQEISLASPTEAATVFANQTTVLADLSQANAGTVFSWEVQFTTSVATQGYSGDFLLSTTANTGLGTAPPPSVPLRPILGGITVSFDLADSFAQAASFGGSIDGAAPFSQVGIEASADLGETDPWTVIRTLTADSLGRATLSDLRHPANPNAPKMFLRAHTD